MDMGRQCDDEALKQRMAMAQPNKCCTLIYTVGEEMNYIYMGFLCLYLLTD